MRRALEEVSSLAQGRALLLDRGEGLGDSAQAQQAEPGEQAEHAKRGKGRPPAHEVRDEAAKSRGEPLPSKGDAHEKADGAGALLGWDDVADERLRDRDDAGGKAAGEDSRRHESLERRRRGTHDRAYRQPQDDDAQKPLATDAVPDGAANRLKHSVGNEVRREHHGSDGRRYGERLGYGGQRRRDEPVVRSRDQSAESQRDDNTSLIDRHGCPLPRSFFDSQP